MGICVLPCLFALGIPRPANALASRSLTVQKSSKLSLGSPAGWATAPLTLAVSKYRPRSNAALPIYESDRCPHIKLPLAFRPEIALVTGVKSIPNRMSHLGRLIAFIALLNALPAVTVAGESKEKTKPIGFSLQVSGDGFFNPTVTKAVVKAILPGTPAEAAGIKVGDELVKVEGVVVPGNSGSVLKHRMEFVPGKPKKMVFKRPDETEYEVILTRSAPAN